MSSEVDVITLITYICGVLGLILLLLCIILAIIFIYSICRPNSVPFRQRGGARAGNYALVPSDGQGHAAENGQAVVSKGEQYFLSINMCVRMCNFMIHFFVIDPPGSGLIYRMPLYMGPGGSLYSPDAFYYVRFNAP